MTEMVRRIAAILDHPSVFMGGPSQQNMRKAREVLDALAQPTDEMFAAGEAVDAETECLSSSQAVPMIWDAMIKVARGDEQP